MNVRPSVHENIHSQTLATVRAIIPQQVMQLAQVHSRMIKGAV